MREKKDKGVFSVKRNLSSTLEKEIDDLKRGEEKIDIKQFRKGEGLQNKSQFRPVGRKRSEGEKGTPPYQGKREEKNKGGISSREKQRDKQTEKERGSFPDM